MSGPTNIEEMQILDARLDRTGVLQVGLFTTAPGDDCSGGVEVTGGNYARVNINSVSTQMSPAVAGGPSTKTGPSGSNTWTFNAPSGNWGTIVAAGVWEVFSRTDSGANVGGSNSPLVSDSAAVASDLGRQISGSGFATNTYIVGVTPGSGYAISPNTTGPVSGATIGSKLLYVATLNTPTTVNSGDPAPQFDSTHQITFQAGDPSDSF